MTPSDQSSGRGETALSHRLRQLEKAVARRVEAEQAYAEQFGTGTDSHQEELARQLAQVVDEQTRQVESLTEQFAERRGEIETAHQSQRDAAKREYDAAIARVQREAEQETNRVNQQHEDSRWVASSVLDDSAEESPKRQFDRARSSLEKTREQQQNDCASIAADIEEIRDARGWSDDPLPPPETDANDLESLSAEFTDALTAAQERLNSLRKLRLPRLFTGWRPAGLLIGLTLAIAAAIVMFVPPSLVGTAVQRTDLSWMAMSSVAAAVISVLLLTVLYTISSTQMSDAYSHLREHASAARFFHERWSQLAAKEEQRLVRQYEQVREKREAQLQQQLQRYEAAHQETLSGIDERLQTQKERLSTEYNAQVSDLDAERDAQLARIDQEAEQQISELTQAFESQRMQRQMELDQYSAARQQQQQQAWEQLWRDWLDEVERFDATMAEARERSQQLNLDWSELARSEWQPPREIPDGIRIGQFAVDLGQMEGGVPASEQLIPPQTVFHAPAALHFPDAASLLLETKGQDGRREAVQAIQVALLRLLTRIPPGKLRLTVLDPVGLGESFSGLMHLADYDELLITSRIWTEMGHIEARLAELTEHMENVLQKYLRNEFATIEEYNQFAGEVAEPYHVLVVADFPNKFSEQAARRLVSIATSGPRCGVYLLMSTDRTAQMPNAFDLAAIEAMANTFTWRGGAYHAKESPLNRWPLNIDTPPSPETFTQIVKNVGEASKDIRRVEVSFSRIAPDPDEVWTKDSRSGIDIPLGRAGATKLQHLRLGKGTSQHMLVAGKTGSGKSTFFHTLITNVALYYSPDEVELYLVDFKKGVEFKAYAPVGNEKTGQPHQGNGTAPQPESINNDPTNKRSVSQDVTDGETNSNGQLPVGLPHARVIAVESDREFGVSVLQRLDSVLQERGELFRTMGVQDIAGYRDRVQSSASSAESSEMSDGNVQSSSLDAQRSLPRILLVIDEFQEFFTEDDRYSQQAALLLDRLVRQGRAFGVHVILGSQTLGGAYSLARSTLGQVAVRVALQCSEADAHLILSEENTAARLLTRPGEAIYNDANGMVEGNHPFQIAWLPDEERAGYLGVMQHFAQERGLTLPPPVVFEGNIPSDPARNGELMALVDGREETTAPPAASAPRIWLGESVDIGPPTSISFHPQAGNNLLIVGSDAGAAAGILANSVIALAASGRNAPSHGIEGDTSPQLYVFDGNPPGSPESDLWHRVIDAVSGGVRLVTPQTADKALAELTAERHRRDGSVGEVHSPLFVIVAGLSKFRDLRKSEDEFSLGGFGSSNEDAPPDLGRQFADLISKGPELGMHLLLWADSYSNVDRWLSRQSLREFELRIAFPMNAADSSNLIDSPLASKLGVHRALLYREETGTATKFRPYGPPTAAWLTQVRDALSTASPLEIATDLESFHVT